MRTFLLLLCIGLLNMNSIGQELNAENNDCPPEDAGKLLRKQNKLKALYLYIFTNSVDFEKKKDPEFKVAFLQSDSIKQYFDGIQKGKKESHILTYSIQSLEDITNYQLVYIDCNYEFEQADLEKAIGESQTLIVTDNRIENNFMVNFRIENCKVQYELNEKAMIDHQMVPNHDMIKGAI